MALLNIPLGNDDDDLMSSISASLQAYNLDDSTTPTDTLPSVSPSTIQAPAQVTSSSEHEPMHSQTRTQESTTSDPDTACNASIASTVGLGHLSSDELEKYLASASRTVRRMLKARGMSLPPVRVGGGGSVNEVAGEGDEGKKSMDDEPTKEKDEEIEVITHAPSGGEMRGSKEEGTIEIAEERLSDRGEGKEAAVSPGDQAEISDASPMGSCASASERRWSDVAAARPFSPSQGPVSEDGKSRWSDVGAIRPFSPSQASGPIDPISPDTDVDTGSTASTILIQDRNDVSRWTSASPFQPGSNTAGSICATTMPQSMPGHSDRSYVHRPLGPIDPYDQGPLVHHFNDSISKQAIQMQTLDGIMRTLAGQRAMASFELARIYEEAWRAGLEITTDGYIASEGEVRAGRVWKPVGWLGTGWGKDGRAFEGIQPSEEEVSEVVQALEVQASEERGMMAYEEEWPVVGEKGPASE